MPSEQRSAAIRDYHDLLAGRHLATTVAQLERATEERQLYFDGRPICHLLRPFFLDAATYRSVCQATTLVMRGLDVLSRRLAADPALRRHLHLSPQEERVIRLDPGEPTEVYGRIDGFLDAEGVIRFIEYNPLASGVFNLDGLAEGFAAMPVMQELGLRHRARCVPIKDLAFDALLDAYRQRGGEGLPSIGVLGAGDAGAGAAVPDEIEMVRAQGCPLRLVGAAELAYSAGRLSAEGLGLDVLFVLDWPALLAETGDDHPLWRAAREGAVWIANSLSASILRGSKSVLAMLSDPDHAHLFEPEVAAALARHLPWTRKVRQGRTTRRGKEVELAPFIAAHREQLVLKPADEEGGKGVVLGWECSAAGWSSALEAALAGHYVVQERVAGSREVFPSLVDGALRLDEYLFDLDPYVWRHEHVSGCMVRLSKTALMNVAAGTGSNIPMFLLGE